MNTPFEPEQEKTANSTQAQNADSSSTATDNGQRLSPLLEKKRRELLLYLSVSIAAVEMLLLVGCIFYSFMSAETKGAASFPWLVWGSLAIIFPAVILLAVHQADVGLFRRSVQNSDHDWEKHLPERMQRIYRIIKRAPAVVVLLGLIVLGAALLTLDEAFSMLKSLGVAVQPHIPIIVSGIAAIAVITIVAVAWLNYRTRRLYAEYTFRREVLEKTGIIIVDKGSTALPPADGSTSPYTMLEAGSAPTAEPKALAQGQDDNNEVIDADAREVEVK